MKKTKKALASLAIAGMVLSMAPMSVFGATTTTDRIFGADRIETAVKVAQAGWTTAATVIVAPAADANLVDALAAAPLAGQEKAPILLTDGAALDAKTKQAIVDLKATKVFAVGALDDQVVADLQGITGVTVEALKGADRIETAAKIVAKLSAPAGSFVVGYGALADALSVASFAAANNYSILVANPDGTLPASETAVGTKYVIGGPTLVADVAGAERLYGADRFATNKAVLNELSYEYDKAYVANGEDAHLVDSLVASSLAANDKAAIVLGDMTSAAAAADVSAKLASDSQVIALGGTAVVTDAVKNSVKYIVPATLAVESVSAINAKEIVVKFNTAVNEGSAETEANYSVEVGDITETFTATLEDDKKTVTLLLDNPIQAITSVEVTVDEDILDADLNVLGEDFESVSIFEDEVDPSIVKAEIDGDELTVTFSEYVDTIGLVKVNGEDFTGDEEALPAKEVVYNIGALDLEDGKYYVTFGNVADMQAPANVAGYLTTSFTISGVDTAPKVASVEQTGNYEFEVEFTKNIDATDLTIAAKNAGIDLVTGVVVADDLATITLDAALADELYDDGSFTLALTVNGYQALSNDMYGDKYTSTLKMTEDTTGPVLVAGYNKINATSYFELRFDEAISFVDALPSVSDLTIVNADGVKLTASDLSIELESTEVDAELTVLSFTLTTPVDADTYTVTVASGLVEDAYLNDNKAFTTTVKKAAADAKVYVVASGSGDEITLAFYEDEAETTLVKMGASALTLANYKLDGNALPAGTSIYFTSDAKDTVVITLPDASIKSATGEVLQISANVLGADSEKLATAELYQVVNGLTDNVKPTLVAAEKTGVGEITLTFNEKMDASTFDASDLIVKVNGVTVDLGVVFEMVAPDVNGDSKEVIINTVNDYNTSQTVTVTVDDETLNSTDVAGNAITKDTSVTATK